MFLNKRTSFKCMPLCCSTLCITQNYPAFHHCAIHCKGQPYTTQKHMCPVTHPSLVQCMWIRPSQIQHMYTYTLIGYLQGNMGTCVNYTYFGALMSRHISAVKSPNYLSVFSKLRLISERQYLWRVWPRIIKLLKWYILFYWWAPYRCNM